MLLKYLKGRYRKESDARPLDLLCRLVVSHCGQADATFCRVAQEHGLLLRRFARATKALGRSVDAKPLCGGIVAGAPRRVEDGEDEAATPEDDRARGARRPTQEEKRRDAALASLRAIATKDTAPLLARIAAKFAGAVSPAEVYACAARREAFHALEGDAGDLERAAAERAAPLFARAATTDERAAVDALAAAFFENFGGESLEPLGRLAAGLASRVGSPLEPRLRSIRSSLEALGLAAGFGSDAARATRDAARMAATTGGDPALVDAARAAADALAAGGARADVVLQAFLLLTDVGAAGGSDEARGAAEAATREAFANAAAALVLGPLFGDGEDGDRSLSRDAADAALAAAAALGDRADGDPEGAAGFAGALAGALARRGELVRDGDDEDSSAERLRALGVLDGLARARGAGGAAPAVADDAAATPPPAEAPAHPCFFAVSELVARGWGAERARHVAAGDLATAEGARALFADLLSAALAGPPGDLRKKARLLWSLLDLAHAREPPGDEDRRRQADRRGASSAAEAVAALRGVNVDVDGEPFGLCWLQLLHALRGDAATLCDAAKRGPPRGGRPDCVGEARLYAALPPGAARFKAGLRAAHASVRWAAARDLAAAWAAAPGAGGDLGDDLLRSGAALAAMDAGGDGHVYAALAAAPAAAAGAPLVESRPFKVACVVLAAAARRHHGDFLAVARAAHAFSGTPPSLATTRAGLALAARLLDDGRAGARGWDAWPELRDAAAAALAAYADPAG